MISPTALAGKGSFGLFRLLFKYYWIFAIIFLVLPAIADSVNRGLEEEDWKIPIKDTAIMMASFDETIYSEVQELEFETDADSKIGRYLNLFWFLITKLRRPLFAMFITFIFLFKTIRFFGGDDSKTLRAVFLSILIMVILQILVSGVPFKGVYSLAKFVWGVL